MREMGGFATFGQLNRAALLVPGVEWKTKTPFASIRRIVQQDGRFFRIRPGLWALSEERAAILAQFALPVDKPEAPAEEFDHAYYQGLLVEIGNLRGLGTFIPYQDKNRRFLGRTLADVATVERFHEFTYPEVVRRAVTVDVTWFNPRRLPRAFFEVEHSTDIYNSLLKFVELQDFHADFRIVADSAREREFRDRLAGRAFDDIRARVGFVSYGTVEHLHTQAFEYDAAARAFSG
jgi:hypothetical protein